MVMITAAILNTKKSNSKNKNGNNNNIRIITKPQP